MLDGVGKIIGADAKAAATAPVRRRNLDQGNVTRELTKREQSWQRREMTRDDLQASQRTQTSKSAVGDEADSR
jgi:hypothetical protein